LRLTSWNVHVTVRSVLSRLLSDENGDVVLLVRAR
jgi:hypothetical protein